MVILCMLIAVGCIALITSYILNRDRNRGGSDDLLWVGPSDNELEDQPSNQGHLSKRSIEGDEGKVLDNLLKNTLTIYWCNNLT